MTSKTNVTGTTQLHTDVQAADAAPVRFDGKIARREFFGPNGLLRLQRDLAAVHAPTAKARTAEAAAPHAMAMAAKTYSFVSVDYPGAAFTEILDSNGSTDVGVFSANPATAINQCFTHSGNDYQIFNVPGSTAAILFTINSLGVMGGAYNDVANKLHGFVDDAGAITNVDFPGAMQTAVVGINDAGDTSGIWIDAANKTHGFVNKAGIFTAIDHPGAIITEVTGINASGDVTGIWEDASSVSHGFIWSNGAFTNIDFPGATSTAIFGINDSGEVAGYYIDASSVTHGFLYQNSFSIVDVAGATGTLLTRISNAGDLAGVFVDALNESHGLTAH
jgi:probable HAF family extracellular repeat protein